jgi:putative DNA primase/helicase
MQTHPPFPGTAQEYAEAISQVWKASNLGMNQSVPAVFATDEVSGSAVFMGNDLGNFRPTDFSDVGNAGRFVEFIQGHVVWTSGIGWLIWNGKVWRPDENAVAKLAKLFTDGMLEDAQCKLSGAQVERIRAQSSGGIDLGEVRGKERGGETYLRHALRTRNKQRIDAFIALTKSSLAVPIESLDADPWLLNTASGIVDLRTGEISPHSPDKLCTRICCASPERAEHSDRWGDFLQDITCEDPELQRYLQVLFGMAAVGKVFREGIAIFYGNGANGKSTLLNPIRAVLGDYAATIAPEVLMVSRFQQEVRGLAALRGRRLVLATETETGQRLSAATVKRLASTDRIVARELYKEAVEFEPSHLLIMSTNHLPKIGDADHGIWRRIHAVPFAARFDAEGRKPIPNFGDVLLREEGGAILAWIIEGAAAFYKRGCTLPPCKAVDVATEQYRDASDWMARFLDEVCVQGIGKKYASGALYAAYSAWSDAQGEYTRNSNDFSAELQRRDFTKDRTKAGYVWHGLEVRADWAVGIGNAPRSCSQ